MTFWQKILSLFFRKVEKRIDDSLDEYIQRIDEVDEQNDKLEKVEVEAKPVDPEPEIEETAEPRTPRNQKRCKSRNNIIERLKRLSFKKSELVFKTAHAGEATERKGELVLVCPVKVDVKDVKLCGPLKCRAFDKYTGAGNWTFIDGVKRDRYHYRLYNAYHKDFSNNRSAKGCYIEIMGVRFDLKARIGERSG